MVPIGWSWAIWLAQRVHQFLALEHSGLSEDRLLVDGRPAPDISDSVYADNLNIAGINAAAVQAAKDGAVARLREALLSVHEESMRKSMLLDILRHWA